MIKFYPTNMLNYLYKFFLFLIFISLSYSSVNAKDLIETREKWLTNSIKRVVKIYNDGSKEKEQLYFAPTYSVPTYNKSGQQVKIVTYGNGDVKRVQETGTLQETSFTKDYSTVSRVYEYEDGEINTHEVNLLKEKEVWTDNSNKKMVYTFEDGTKKKVTTYIPPTYSVPTYNKSGQQVKIVTYGNGDVKRVQETGTLQETSFTKDYSTVSRVYEYEDGEINTHEVNLLKEKEVWTDNSNKKMVYTFEDGTKKKVTTYIPPTYSVPTYNKSGQQVKIVTYGNGDVKRVQETGTLQETSFTKDYSTVSRVYEYEDGEINTHEVNLLKEKEVWTDNSNKKMVYTFEDGTKKKVTTYIPPTYSVPTYNKSGQQVKIVTYGNGDVKRVQETGTLQETSFTKDYSTVSRVYEYEDGEINTHEVNLLKEKEVWTDNSNKKMVYTFEDGTKKKVTTYIPPTYSVPTYNKSGQQVKIVTYGNGDVKRVQETGTLQETSFTKDYSTVSRVYEYEDGEINTHEVNLLKEKEVWTDNSNKKMVYTFEDGTKKKVTTYIPPTYSVPTYNKSGQQVKIATYGNGDVKRVQETGTLQETSFAEDYSTVSRVYEYEDGEINTHEVNFT